MYNLDYISFENLLSCKKARIKINNNKCTVIFGINLTDSGFKNNGSGKSVFIDAISIAIRNEVIRDIPKEKFIKRGEKICIVEAFFVNDTLNENFLIRRKISKSSTVCELYENIVDINNIKESEKNNRLVSVTEYNQRITELLGLKNEDIFRYFILGQGNNHSFFTSNDTGKKELLNRITQSDIIKPLFKIMEDDYKNKEKIIREKYDDVILSLESINEVLLSDKNQEEEKSDLEEQLKEYDDLILEEENQIKKEKEKIKEFKVLSQKKEKEKKFLSFDENKIEQLEDNFRNINNRIKDIEKELDANNDCFKKIERELKGKIQCPHCKKEFVVDSKFDMTLKEMKTSQEFLEKDIEKLEKEIDKKQLEKQKIREEKQVEENKKEDLERIENDIKLTNKKIVNSENLISLSEKNIKKYEIDREKLKDNDSSMKKIKELNLKIEKNNLEINRLTDEKIEKIKELEIISFWQNKLGKSGFMTYLANKSIKIVEGMTNYFLEKMNTKLSINIEPFKILQSGEVRDKIDIRVLDSGMDIGDFNGCSGGEQQRIVIAGILSTQKLLNISTDGRGLNLLCLDETLHYVDSEGMEKNINILNSIERTILLITQNLDIEEINLQNKICVRKIKRESIYEEEYNR